MLNKSEECEYGIVLGGGGTRGAYQVGALKAIKELNLNIKCIVGTSIGALNGALFLQDDINKMEEIYDTIKITDVMKIDDSEYHNKNLFNILNIPKLTKEYKEQKGISNDPLRKIIEKYINVDKVYNSSIDYGLVTFKTTDRTSVELFKKDIKKEEFIEYLLASSCFPIFKPQQIGKHKYLDGGFIDNIPINMLLKNKYKNVIVVDVAGPAIRRKLISKDIYLKVVSPQDELGGLLDFDSEQIKNNIKLGYLDTLKTFNKLQGYVYYFETAEFNKMIETFGLQTIYGLEHAAQIYNMYKLRTYTFEEFITELRKRHTEAQEKYNKLRKLIRDKSIFNVRGKKYFDKGLGICFTTDLYLQNPTANKFIYMERFMKDYIKSAKALLELG